LEDQKQGNSRKSGKEEGTQKKAGRGKKKTKSTKTPPLRPPKKMLTQAGAKNRRLLGQIRTSFETGKGIGRYRQFNGKKPKKKTIPGNKKLFRPTLNKNSK